MVRMSARTYNGSPCPKCGGTLRYANNRHCVPCKAIYNKGRRQDYSRPAMEEPCAAPLRIPSSWPSDSSIKPPTMAQLMAGR